MELCFSFKFLSLLWVLASDDGTGPEKIAHIMGPPDRCEHAARIINDLLQSLRVGGTGQAGRPVGADRPGPVSRILPIPQVSVVPVPGRSRQGAHWLCLEKQLHRATGPGAAAPWGVGG